MPSCFYEDSNFKSESQVQFKFNGEFKTERKYISNSELKYISNSISIKNQFKRHFIPVFIFQTYFQSISDLIPILKI